MKLKYVINALPLVALTLVIATSCNRVFLPDADQSQGSDEPEGASRSQYRSKMVNVPENRQVPQSEEWQVFKVTDGDSISVRQGNRKERIRLCGTDAPEVKRGREPGQPLAQESKNNLTRLIAEANGKVQVTIVDRDQYKRAIAEVFTVLGNGTEKFLQEEQTLAGLSFAYRDYLSDCPNASSILKAEEIAKENRAGVWSDSNTVPPWEYRRQQRRKGS